MRRREFITLLSGAAAAWPLAARAQQAAMPVIGFLNTASLASAAHNLDAFRQGLKEAGYVEGQNFAVEYRWAEGRYERMPELAADLVQRNVAAILASGAGGLGVKAASAATKSIPIVFLGGIDAVELGVVASLNRPGGNVTGVTFLANALEAKRLGLLHELLPKATTIAVLLNPDNASGEGQLKDLNDAASTLGIKLVLGKAHAESEFESVFAVFAQAGARGLVVAADSFFANARAKLTTLAARNKIAAIYHDREIALAGGLMSYGASIAEGWRVAGVYVGRVLNGEKPAELPVVQSAKFEFVLNLKTMKALGLTVPAGLLAIADEVIE